MATVAGWEALANGSKGKRVRELQEWLGLHDCHTGIDGVFGPATELAVKQFQRRAGIRQTGVVDARTYDALLEPMRAVKANIAVSGQSLGAMVVAYAKQHLRQHPREIGGQNMGPWVRLYMDGHQGPEYPWCAGFACHVLRQACDALGRPLPIRTSFSCDYLAAQAQAKGLFVSNPGGNASGGIKPGAFFLVRRTPTDWTHTGIVIEVATQTITTVEGNTNDSGDREGYEVCQRIRGYKGKDFICW